ncbi:hypothetical protein V866_002791 [Kwoniella sp. B9012]|uniref:Chitin-binding type-2 domain-containing protein n=1 Tax=Kwoniella europaea PYCC6329 TaxID=1423913 RepID=A0AAX4KE60_9TREE
MSQRAPSQDSEYSNSVNASSSGSTEDSSVTVDTYLPPGTVIASSTGEYTHFYDCPNGYFQVTECAWPEKN